METRAHEALVRADIVTGIEKEHRGSVLTKTFMKKKKNEKTFISYVGRISAKVPSVLCGLRRMESLEICTADIDIWLSREVYENCIVDYNQNVSKYLFKK